MKKTLIIALLVTGLSACNSDNNNSPSSDSGESRAADSQIDANNTDSTVFEDIAGVYRLSLEDARDGDETYLVVRADGSYAEYDYAGDSYAAELGEHRNCYRVDDYGWHFEEKSSTRFSLVKEGQSYEEFEFSEENAKMFFVIDGNVVDYHWTFDRVTTLIESDLVPNCNNVES